MTRTATIDFETRSAAKLKTVGAYVYAMHPTTDVLMLAWKIEETPTRLWLPGDTPPHALFDHLAQNGDVEAHNVQFDRLIWNHVMHLRYGWPALPLDRCRCSAATAVALGLPRALGPLGETLGLSLQKDKRGNALIARFCKPGRDGNWKEPAAYPDDFKEFGEYCVRDVDSEHEASRRMMPLSADEHAVWRLSEQINDRGLRIDVASAQAALRLAETAKTHLNQKMSLATYGYVTACTQVTRLVEWVNRQNTALPSATKADIAAALARDDLPDAIRTILTLRQEAAKTSVAKLDAMLARIGPDQRVRGAFLYHAASTGRWSSVGVQLQNLPRPREIFKEAHLDETSLFDAIRSESPEWLQFLYGDILGRPLDLLADALRGFIVSAPDHELIVADYAGIESAVAAWLCGETWKITALFDLLTDPSQPDMYQRAASKIYGVPPKDIPKKDPRRQVGKVGELSLQYQGGPGAYYAMSRNYDLRLDSIYDHVWAVGPEYRKEQASRRYDTVQDQRLPVATSLTKREFLAAELVKLGWREGHPAICKAWTTLQNAALEAVANPGSSVPALKVKFLVQHGFLWCLLPSQRCLAYAAPRLKAQVRARRINAKESEIMDLETAQRGVRDGLVRIEGDAAPAVTVSGVNSVTYKSERYAVYGGLLLENITQAVARDALVTGIRQAEAAGYPVIGHVHDEIITEVPCGYGDVPTFEKLVCTLPPWAAGLPLGAHGWRGTRYRKD